MFYLRLRGLYCILGLWLQFALDLSDAGQELDFWLQSYVRVIPTMFVLSFRKTVINPENEIDGSMFEKMAIVRCDVRYQFFQSCEFGDNFNVKNKLRHRHLASAVWPL